MLSVNKFENTLRISKYIAKICEPSPCEASKGLSSGMLEVIKTESELCLRPGSPDRYKSENKFEEATPYTKISSLRESSSESSYQEISSLPELIQTPDMELSLSLVFEAEDIPSQSYSFFSSANEVKEMPLFRCDKETKEKAPTSDSFASTKSKTEKFVAERVRRKDENKRNYRNNCKIECTKCLTRITTDIKMSYSNVSL